MPPSLERVFVRMGSAGMPPKPTYDTDKIPPQTAITPRGDFESESALRGTFPPTSVCES